MPVPPFRIAARLVPLAAVGAVLALGACDGKPGPRADAGAGTASVARTDPSAAALAAAEPYEALTESAFDVPVKDLKTRLGVANSAFERAGPTLPAGARREIATLNERIGQALGAGDRTAVALGAVEAYRILVSAHPPAPSGVPVDVHLLDYAGFRYTALMQSRPIRWSEMSATVADARTRWTALAPTVRSAGLKGAVEEALRGMEAGAKLRNAPLAAHAVATELALVDALEEAAARP